MWSSDSTYAVVIQDRGRGPDLANVRELALGVLNQGAPFTGVATTTLTISPATAGLAGDYSCVVTNTCGNQPSNAASLTIEQTGCGTSDFDGDGDFGTDSDIEAFFSCLGGNCCAACYPGGGDFNADGDVGTDSDIESFFRVLGGGAC